MSYLRPRYTASSLATSTNNSNQPPQRRQRQLHIVHDIHERPNRSHGPKEEQRGRRRLAVLGGDGGLLIGIDLPKPVPVLIAAYDDEQGVTAEFNLNVLNHVNRLLGSDFNLQDWAHEARFDSRTSRIEMHLRARRPVMVCWPQGLRYFAQGETIHTENSYKYPLSDFLSMLACAGFAEPRVWTDEQQWFAVIHAHA